MQLHLQHQDIVVGRGCLRRLLRRLGAYGDLSEVQNQSAASRAQDLSISAARGADRLARSGVVRRHSVRTNEVRLLMSGSDHGLTQPCGAGLAVVEH